MEFRRTIQENIENYIQTREIIVLTGMRRVGKTTLMNMIYQKLPSNNKVFLDFENIIDQRIFEEDDFNNIWNNLKYYGISNKSKAYIFIDELQNKPETVSPVKYLYDHYDVKFFITGSSSFYLKNLFPESLSGRKFTFELFPLDFREFLVFKDLQKDFVFDFEQKDHLKNYISHEKLKTYFEEYLHFGGFPQVVLNENEDKKKSMLSDIFRAYYEKDVLLISDFKNISAFKDLAFLLLQRTGSKLEISKLASEIGVSRDTIYAYLGFLQGTYFIHLVPPYTTNPDREVSGSKKIYICDNGIINLFAKIDQGSLLENAVFNCLRPYGRIYYYQKRSGAEIDFVFPEVKLSLEVKTTGNVFDLKKLKKTSSGIGFENSYLITQKFHSEPGYIPVTELG